MTSSTQSNGAPEDSPNPGRPKKRRKKKKRKADEQLSAAVAQAKQPAAPQSFGRALVFLGVALAAAVFYVKVSPNDGNRPFALVAVGVASFLCGASPGVDPQRAVAIFGALVAVGLAIIGIDANEVGTVLAMGGGLGLGGGIHRLGRLGPDEGASSERPETAGS